MNKSFTLIEILVVIVVIGVLSAFILVGMSSITSSASIARGQAFVNSLDNSLLLARVSQWKLDEGTGASVNDSWGTNTGAFGSSPANPAWVNSGCVSNKCLSFDGGDYVNVGDPASGSLDFGTGNFTISAWIKLNSLSGSGYAIVSKQDSAWTDAAGWTFSVNGDDIIFYRYDGAGPSRLQRKNDIFTQAGVWYHVMAVCNYNSSIDLYINAIEPSTYNNTYTAWSTLSNAQNFQIGAQANIQMLFNGSIDDVRIYNQAISTSQIQQNYYVGINKLFRNNGIVIKEYNQRLSELRESLSNK